MDVSLSPELARFVEEKIRTGMFNSQSEVVRMGLQLLGERDQLHEAQLARLRGEVAAGLEQARRGELVSGDQIFDDIEERSRARREEHL